MNASLEFVTSLFSTVDLFWSVPQNSLKLDIFCIIAACIVVNIKYSVVAF